MTAKLNAVTMSLNDSYGETPDGPLLADTCPMPMATAFSEGRRVVRYQGPVA